MSQLISARLSDNTADRVKLYARRKQRSVNETVSLALEEWLRQNEFASIEFRDTPDGRLAFMKNSRLSVSDVIRVAKGYDMKIDRVLEHWPDRSPQWDQAMHPSGHHWRVEQDCIRRLSGTDVDCLPLQKWRLAH